MISRIYVDNYKALVNFQLPLERMNVFLGANGSGKTTVFETINLVRQLLQGAPLEANHRSLTRWDSRNVQTFQIDTTIEGRSYRYTLEVEVDRETQKHRIKSEDLLYEGERPLFRASLGKAQLYRDDGSAGPEVLSDWRRSSLPVIAGRPENRLLTKFTSSWSRVFLFQFNPSLLDPHSEEEDETLRTDLANFASWWRHVHAGNVRASSELRKLLADVLPGFEGLQFAAIGGGTKRLEAVFGDQSYGFDELSEGQRVLIVLHALLVSSGDRDITLCLDEPDNFVALREIQPFCHLLEERQDIQTLLISHHPSVLNLHAVDSGIVFRRGINAPVRVERFAASPDETLTVADLVMRGYLDGTE
jgi:predicted ATPase